MKLLVAIKSCQRDLELGFHEAIRDTWGKDFLHKIAANTEVRYFIGNGTTRYYDEVQLTCADDYLGLPRKTQEICKWAGDRYDHIFLCDNDTFVKPVELMQSGFINYDYSGYFCGGQGEVHTRFDYKDHMGEYPQSYPWCSGGIGYFLSQKAADIVARTSPTVWAEDMYVGQVLGPWIESNVLKAGHIEINNVATWHHRESKMYPKFTPDMLRRIYRDGDPQKLYDEAGI